jgi:hypothetical protein
MEERKKTGTKIRQRPPLSPAIYTATADILHGRNKGPTQPDMCQPTWHAFDTYVAWRDVAVNIAWLGYKGYCSYIYLFEGFFIHFVGQPFLFIGKCNFKIWCISDFFF